MTTLTAVSVCHTAPPPPRSSEGGRVWVTVSVLALLISTLLVAGYLEYRGWALLVEDQHPQRVVSFAAVWGLSFLSGVFRTAGTAIVIGLAPVALLLAVPAWRPRSYRGPLALVGAGVAAVLCVVGILTAIG